MKAMKTISDLGFKKIANFGKYYITHAYTNTSVMISKEEYYNLTDRGLVRKYFPNWKDSL